MKAYYRNEHGQSPVVLRSPEDVDNLIDELLVSDPSGNMAFLHSLERPLMPAGVPDHKLMVGAEGGLQVGVLTFVDDGNFVSLGPDAGRGEVSYSVTENATEFPVRSEIPITLVRRAVKEFLSSSGKRPECVEWQVPEIW
ncbi:Imm1 family immunity protein [Streptomyces sp. NBC_00063]|uniref:Imm1 family immunity protein n=1 Tax=Streptomyces sp. NBC_00063 TaxID=2975638 RepID=UPI003D72A540